MTVTFFALLAVVISAIFAQYKQLHILQQNSYLPAKYFKWLIQSYTVQLALSTVAYCGITLLLSKDKDWFALMIAVLVLVVRVVSNIVAQKEATQKLVFTARVKRMYITAIVLLFISLFICVMTDTDVASSVEQIGNNIFLFPDIMVSEISRTVCMLLSAVSPILTIVIWLLTLPIEKLLVKKGNSDSESILDVNEESDEVKTNTQEKTEQTEVADLSYESFINNYDDKGAGF